MRPVWTPEARRRGGLRRAELHRDKLAEWARKGGEQTARNYTPEEHAEWGREGNRRRWGEGDSHV